MASGGYKGLRIYQEGHRLAVEVHRMSLKLPKFEMYEEGGQIRRSSKSVPTNIVEGYGRRPYKNDYLRFLVYAHASCGETREHLELLHDCQSLDSTGFQKLLSAYDALGRQIFYFADSVAKEHVSPGQYRNEANAPTVKESSAVYEPLDPDFVKWLEDERRGDEGETER